LCANFKLLKRRKWIFYASGSPIDLVQESNTKFRAKAAFDGIIQIAKCPGDAPEGESILDQCAGAYPVGTTLSASVNGNSGSYEFVFETVGHSSPFMFALPHHIQAFTTESRKQVTPLHLYSTTKGLMTGVTGNRWLFSEPDLPISIGFGPWTWSSSQQLSLTPDALKTISQAASAEIAGDYNAQSNLNSMYFSGKALSKFAILAWIAHDILRDPKLAAEGLRKLKDAFAVFAENRQQFPLNYEKAWGGLVSTAAYITGDPGVDFGGSYYNDHHFHYGYFIHAAAIIGYLDPSWLGQNRDWVNLLVRDTGNPSATKDTQFPFSRSFDWFHGHSWAKGLFESADGKDQESTSEDCMYAYSVKMWGRISRDTAMEARGNLMLAILRRSLQNYFLMENNNAVQPAKFIHNKVTGILFENKIDHATYFGSNIEYIQGIHMIPTLPFAAYTRNSTFVKEEWEAYFSNGRVDNVGGGWRGILYANLALIDPRASWSFFAREPFDWGFIDGGQSRAWALLNAAGKY
jgi:endo-1,3(4)-beta-glucanase